MADRGFVERMHSDWLMPARLMPTPHTALEKAAMAASLSKKPAKKFLTKTRLTLGVAAVSVAVVVPSISLEAMVSTLSGPYFGDPKSEPAPEPVSANAVDATLPTDLWTPAQQAAGPIYAAALAEDAETRSISSQTRFSSFDRELPLAVLDGGSESFDLAFAGVQAPSPLTAIVAPAPSFEPTNLALARGSALVTKSVSIEQIVNIDLVVRATPDNAGPSQQALASNAPSARTQTIANRSVEAAFAGVIDASAAARNSLPIAQKPQTNVLQPNSAQPAADVARRAIPAGAPPPQVSATAAAELALIPKSKLDARVNGVLTGSVEFQQLDGTIAIRLRSVAHMMREQFSETEFSEIVGGQAIDSFVPLAQLQAAGIPVSYNPAYDEVEFGIDYQDAPNAKKVQIDQISIAPIGPELTAIEQIPR